MNFSFVRSLKTYTTLLLTGAMLFTIGCEDDTHDDHDHDHDEEHGAALHIIGVSSGSTSFQLKLMHDGHADYTSTNDVVVTVN